MTTDKRQGWLANLKAGDYVIVHSRYNDYVEQIQTITPTGRIRTKNKEFNPDGWQRGGDTWSSFSLDEATPEALKKISDKEDVSNAIRLMRNTAKITHEQALKIIEVLGGDSD